MKILLNILFMILILSSSIFGQFISDVSKRGTVAAPFLKISQGARATSMGNAFVSVADDPSAIYWNPAGIARLGKNSVIFDHTMWIADVKYNFAALTVDLGSFGTLGASFTMSDIGDMKVTTVDEPNGTGEIFTATDVAFSIAWAYNLTDNFSIGFNPKVINQSIWKMSATTLALDLGVLYNTPFQGITLGMSITNFGYKMKLDGQSTLFLVDPDDESSGNNDQIPANLQTDAWDLPQEFKFGVSYKPINTEMHKFLVAVDASVPNDNYESMNIGGEYTFSNMFSIRGGYKSLFLPDSEESFTLGAGFKQLLMGNITIFVDYSYSDFDRLNNSQKFSIGVTF